MHQRLAAVLACASSLAAQQAIYSSVPTHVVHDSGFLDNPAPTEQVVWSQDVSAAGDWIQLRFADTHLDGGSRLRIYPPEDPSWVQWHDARSIVDYRYWSCEFPGSVVRVDLVAAPGSVANRTRIDLAVAIDVGNNVSTDTICGPTDDRVLSSDPRACRVGGCSAWLFSEYAVGTAGHCTTSTAGMILHFNVPLSTSSGALVPAHPNDQYALEPFLMRLSGSVGGDWAVCAAVRNSNTSLLPGQAQGGWYAIAPAPPLAGGQQIRVTGYGTGNGSTGSPTGNRAQKSLAGPRVAPNDAWAVRYQTDTTGGNSGSPVLYEATGELVAVHTHGGCTSSGGGGNNGTDTARPDFAAARTAVLALHTIGSIGVFGTGCGSQSGVPALSVQGIPEPGRAFVMRTTGLDPTISALGWFIIGTSATAWNGAGLPLDLAPIGIAGCQLLTSLDFTDTVFSSLGVCTRAYVVPGNPGLVGTHLYFQYFGFDLTAPNTLGIVASNGVDMLVGN